MREIDPFSYYLGQASVIPGFGGDNPPPEPGYCFHTDYVSVRPGVASYHLQLRGVHASGGRLALRIHSLRRDREENAKFVAGAQIDVRNADGQDLSIGVPFVAESQAQYAFYGKFVKDTDIRAQTLIVSLDERPGQGQDYVAPPPSVLVSPKDLQEPMQAKALLHVLSHPLLTPVSQDCTMRHVAELKAEADVSRGLDDWGEALCLNALRLHGATGQALEGIVVGHCSESFIDALRNAGFDLNSFACSPPPPENSIMFGDFMVCPEGLPQDEDSASRWNTIRAWFARLKIGGIGVVTCRFLPSQFASSPDPVVDGSRITRSEIEKWALQLMIEGFSVAPLVFSTVEELQIDDAGLARFALIGRRL